MWFGHRYSEKGMAPDPNKDKVIQEWPEPRDKAEVKLFLQIKIDTLNRVYKQKTYEKALAHSSQRLRSM